MVTTSSFTRRLSKRYPLLLLTLVIILVISSAIFFRSFMIDVDDQHPVMGQEIKSHLYDDNLPNQIMKSEQEGSAKSQLASEIRSLQQKLQLLESRLKELEGSQSQEGKVFPKTHNLPFSQRKRILVTGGAGFVGSHLVDRLMLRGHEVAVADNFFTGRKRNVEHWLGHERFELIHHDIVNPMMIEVDEIYHLASPASPKHYMSNPVKTIKVNTVGTINMLGLAKRVGAKILVASTSEVYGDPEEHPQNEDYWGRVNPIGPRSCYDEGKRVAESLTYAYAKQENLDVRVARIFNTYGPRMHVNDGRVVSNFIFRALSNQTLEIYGTGQQTRSFQFVSDLVDGLELLMASNLTSPVNLGNPEEHSVLELSDIVREVVSHSRGESHPSVIKVSFKPHVEDDPQRRRPDITKAMRGLGWWPKVSLRNGLKVTVKYFEQELLHHEATDRKRNDHGGDHHQQGEASAGKDWASLEDKHFILRN